MEDRDLVYTVEFCGRGNWQVIETDTATGERGILQIFNGGQKHLAERSRAFRERMYLEERQRSLTWNAA